MSDPHGEWATSDHRGEGRFGVRFLTKLAVALIVVTVFSTVATVATEPASEERSNAVDKDWWSQVQQGLATHEYRPSKNRHGLQAPNRAHNLRTYFDGSGIRVYDRKLAQAPQLVGLSLTGLGRGDALAPVNAGTMREMTSRVEIVRPGVIEWYENSPLGLEQGFTLVARVPGKGPLVLELLVERARAGLRGQFVELATDAGRTLRYHKLIARDAEGRVLVSRFEVPVPHLVRLVVDDTGATYPLVIDPLISGVADAMLESNQPDPIGFLPAAFGGSVAPAGDVNGDSFADVIVGAPGWDGGDPHEGAAFVFLGSASGIVGSDPSNAHAHIESNQFGAQLGTLPGSVVGDVNRDGFDDIIVGAHFYEGLFQGMPLEVNGAAFVFHGSEAGITGSDPTTADAFIAANELGSDLGQHVSGAGDVNGDGFDDVIVGVPDHGTPFPENIPPNQRSGDYGAALVFHGSPAGITGTGFDDADAVLLPYQDTGLPEPPIYGGIGSVWGAGDVNGDGFDDVVLGGSEIALFLGSATGIVGHDLTDAESRVQPAGPFGFSPFGFIAAGAGDINGDGFDDIIAGSAFRELEPFTARQEGAAFVFLGGPAGLTASDSSQAHATLYGSLLAEWVGASVTGAGDVDHDGFDDVLITAREYPGSLTSEGVTYLFRGGPSGITATTLLDADARLEARQSGAVVLGNNAAFNAAAAGDIDADGFDDVIIGKGYYDAGELNEGAAFLFFGHAWPENPDQPPVANAGADQIVYDHDGNGSASFTVDGNASFDPDGSITSYAWHEDETLLGTDPVLSTTLPASGDHTLVLTVTDDDGVTRGDPVTVRVDIVDSQQLYWDGFAGLGNWITGGDVQLSSADSFPTAPQARIGASGAFMRRSTAMPAGSTGMTLDFWAKTSQFAPSDELRLKVSVDGGPFTTIKTFTSADPEGSYVFYGGSALPLGHSWHPATASSLVIEFESSMSTGLFFVDDVRPRALMAPTGPIADAGSDQAASDTDGDGLESFTLDGSDSSDSGTIVSYEWRESGNLLGAGETLGVSLSPAVHLMTLTVTDVGGESDSDTVMVTLASNQPPVANAGPDRMITDSDGNGSESVTVDAGMSFDPDGSINSVEWRDGPALLGTSAALTLPLAVGDYVLELTVADDAGATTVDTVEISVQAPSATPDPGEANGLQIDGFDAATGKISLTFAPACQAADHNIAYGLLQDVASYGYSGQVCGIGAGGTYDQFVPGAGSYFFLVVGTDGVSKEGSYGLSGALAQRPEQTGDPVCAFTQQIGPSCP